MSKKTIGIENFKDTIFQERIPLDTMKDIWNDHEDEFSNEQLTKMRDFAYLFMETVIEIAKRRKRNNIIELKSSNNESQESNTIHTCQYRRAS